jgi:hypothetical protein
VPPKGFVEELQRRYGSNHDCRFNDVLQRWEIISPSSFGRPVSQFFGWLRNPMNGELNKPDALGLLPFRDLDPEGIKALFQSMDETYIGNRHDGPGTWRRKHEQVTAYNEALSAKYRRQEAVAYADAVHEVNRTRAYLKHHSGSATERQVAWGRQRRVS